MTAEKVRGAAETNLGAASRVDVLRSDGHYEPFLVIILGRTSALENKCLQGSHRRDFTQFYAAHHWT